MATFDEIIENEGGVSATDLEWLHLLVADWQIVADLSIADLALWLRTEDGDYVALAHCRPSTGITLFQRDFVGERLRPSLRGIVDQAYEKKIIFQQDIPRSNDSDAIVRYEAIPMVRGGRVVAVITRHTDIAFVKAPARLELMYLSCAQELLLMGMGGFFPDMSAPVGAARGAPRVGDGLLRLDAVGKVVYASPNGLSVFRRLGFIGDLEGKILSEVTGDLFKNRQSVDGSLQVVVAGKLPWRAEIDIRGVALSLRAIPLRNSVERTGAIILCRDVSELRHRERELLSKDATIREINHRVKNNLQTVAALLRLQARRVDSEEVKHALSQAMLRISSIASVHENLSKGLQQNVKFDDVIDRSFLLVAEVAASDSRIKTQRLGSFGSIPSEYATSLALVLNELVTNAIEHGLQGRGGTVTLVVERNKSETDRNLDVLRIRVCDDGVGMDFVNKKENLGLNIVNTLVGGELGGDIQWRPRLGGGTEVVLDMSIVV